MRECAFVIWCVLCGCVIGWFAPFPEMILIVIVAHVLNSVIGLTLFPPKQNKGYPFLNSERE